MSKRVVIIGAGIGGLTTAALLAQDGYDVVVLEKADQVGGRAGQKKIDGFTFDTGPSWYLMPKVFERTFQLLGSSVERELELIKLTPAYKVFFENDDPITITGNSSTDMATFEAIEPGAGDALKRYIDEGNDIYELSLRHFLYTNFTRLHELMRPDILSRGLRMIRLALTPVHRHVAKYVRDQRLQQILEYPMVFLGSSPFSAPAIYSLMSALDFKEGVFYPKGGLYTIIERIEKRATMAGVELRLGSEVIAIHSQNGKAAEVELKDGSRIRADIVVSNGDIHHTEMSLLAPGDRSYPQTYWEKTEPGVSALLMYIGYKGSLPILEHHNLLFVNEWEQNFTAIYSEKTMPSPASIYVCKPSASDNVAPLGHENLFVLVPIPTGMNLTNKEQSAYADSYLEQIAGMLQQPDLKKNIVHKSLFGPNDFKTRFYSYQASALGSSHLLRQSALFRTPNKSKKLSNLFYVGGNTVPGVGLPMCLIGAELVYERITGKKPEVRT